MMVGELDVAISDQYATIEFVSDQILIRFPDYATAKAITKQSVLSPTLLGKLLALSEIGLRAKIGDRNPIELFPRPSWLLKLLSPTVRDLAKAKRDSTAASRDNG